MLLPIADRANETPLWRVLIVQNYILVLAELGAFG